MVLVCKKDGGIRWCDDYLCLNSLTAKDAYPVPKIEECLDVLGGACVFSTLICYDLYEHTRMPFGLYSAPSTFQRAMELVLRGLQWETLLISLDYIIIL